MTVRAQPLPSRRLAGIVSVGDLTDRSRSAATTVETSVNQIPRSRGAEPHSPGWKLGPELVAIGPHRPIMRARSILTDAPLGPAFF